MQVADRVPTAPIELHLKDTVHRPKRSVRSEHCSANEHVKQTLMESYGSQLKSRLLGATAFDYNQQLIFCVLMEWRQWGNRTYTGRFSGFLYVTGIISLSADGPIVVLSERYSDRAPGLVTAHNIHYVIGIAVHTRR